MTFLRNTWYVAAWADEIDRSLFSRTLLDESVLLYRTEAGEAVAIGNRCPHRFAPLSRGTLQGDTVQCGYHGLRFDRTGACIHNPHGDGRIPTGAAVPRYPLVERDGLLWIWMGEAAKADPARIVSLGHLTDPAYRTIKGVAPVQANFELLVDNLLDLSHTTFLHKHVKSNGFLTADHEVLQQGDTVFSNRLISGEKAPFLFAQSLPDREAPVDHWVNMRWEVPSLCILDAGVTAVGQPSRDGLCNIGSHLLTPETDLTSFYFFAGSRSFLIDDPRVDGQIRDWQEVGLTGEDKPMVEAQQRMMGTSDLLSLKPLMLTPDTAALRARRTLARLIAAEQRGAVAA